MSSDPSPSLPDLRPKQGVSRRFATGRSIAALILREMSTRYGRSPGGYIWAILEPLGAITILGIGFSLLVRAPSLGTSFLLFYATGFLPFNLYQSISVTVARSIIFSHSLLHYPAVTWVDAMVGRFFLNALTGVLVTYILLAGILTFTDTHVVLELGEILEGLALAMLLGLGVGALNCALMGLISAWDMVWSIATRPLFLISGIFYTFEDMPQSVQNVLWYNPLMHIVGIFRAGFYPMYQPSYVSSLYVIIVSLTCLLMGMILLGRFHRDILNR